MQLLFLTTHEWIYWIHFSFYIFIILWVYRFRNIRRVGITFSNFNSLWPKDVIMRSGNGLLPVQCQAITWISPDLLSIWSAKTKFSEIGIKIWKHFFQVNAFENKINSLGPSDAIWHWRSWSTLVQVMACCLTAPSHYLNQCWLIISKVQWHSSDDIIIRRFKDTNQ